MLKRIEPGDEVVEVGISGRRRTAASVIAFTLAFASLSSTGARALDPVAEAHAIRAELTAMIDDLAAATLAADEAARRWMDLRLREMEARAAEQESHTAFSDRVRVAYIAGSGRALEMLLGATDLHDLAARLPYAAAALAEKRLDAREVTARREALAAALRETEEAQRHLIRSEERLTSLRVRIESRLARAEAELASSAEALATLRGVRKHYAGTVDRVAGATRAIRYRKGEAMFQAAAPYLGPRADCSIPKGLRSTGDVIAGDSSWYGNAFRGKPTASGAIFYPERFTVAHRTLPFGLFLLVRMDDRCVVSFLNDRGPYVDGRILDLSYASAQAIGLTGVKDVSATLLVRAS